MRSFSLITLLIALSSAVPAFACRVGGSTILFQKPTAAPTDAVHSSAIQARLQASIPGRDLDKIKPDGIRGYLVGTAEVQRLLRGPTFSGTIAVYLPRPTSCSYFGRGEPRNVVVTGYLVGQLLHDERGAYLAVAEEFRPEPPAPSSNPF